MNDVCAYRLATVQSTDLLYNYDVVCENNLFVHATYSLWEAVCIHTFPCISLLTLYLLCTIIILSIIIVPLKNLHIHDFILCTVLAKMINAQTLNVSYPCQSCEK